MLALPLNATPLIVLAVANVVAVLAFPVIVVCIGCTWSALAAVVLVPTAAVPLVAPTTELNPVMLLKLVPVAVPILGVTNVGLVDNTLFPEPVDVTTPVPPFVAGRIANGLQSVVAVTYDNISPFAGVGAVTLFKLSKLILPPAIEAAEAALTAAAVAELALLVADVEDAVALAFALVALFAELVALNAAFEAEVEASLALAVDTVALLLALVELVLAEVADDAAFVAEVLA